MQSRTPGANFFVAQALLFLLRRRGALPAAAAARGVASSNALSSADARSGACLSKKGCSLACVGEGEFIVPADSEEGVVLFFLYILVQRLSRSRAPLKFFAVFLAVFVS